MAVVGPTGHGKSFLLSCLLRLAGEDNNNQARFVSSREQKGTTVGIDMFSRAIDLQRLLLPSSSDPASASPCSSSSSAAAAPPPPTSSLGGQQESTRNLLLFDVEGLGHNDTGSMSKLLLPAMMMSQVIIFNWKDRVQRETILRDLATYAELARFIEANSTTTSSSSRSSLPRNDNSCTRPFGHLAIVCRDCAEDDLVRLKELRDFLLANEEECDKEAIERNRRRLVIHGAFQGLSVHGLPIPCDNMKHLRAASIPMPVVLPEFDAAIRDLMAQLSDNFDGKLPISHVELTASMLSNLWAKLVIDCNSKIEIAALRRVVYTARCHHAVSDALGYAASIARTQIRPRLPQQPQRLDVQLTEIAQNVQRNFAAGAAGVDDATIAEYRVTLHDALGVLFDDLRKECVQRLESSCESLADEVIRLVKARESAARIPLSLEFLQTTAAAELDALWPSYVDRTSRPDIERKVMDSLAESYHAPNHAQLVAALQQIIALVLGGCSKEAFDAVLILQPALLNGNARQLQMHAAILHKIKMGQFAETLWTRAYLSDPHCLDDASIDDLFCFVDSCTKNFHFDAAEWALLRAVARAQEKHPEKLGDAYYMYGRYFHQRGNHRKAIEIYEKALTFDPLPTGTLFYPHILSKYPNCIKYLGDAQRAKEVAMQMIERARREVTPGVLHFTIRNLRKKNLISEEEFRSLLFRKGADGDISRTKEVTDRSVWTTLFFEAFERKEKVKMDEYAANAVANFAATHEPLRTNVAYALAKYWLKIAKPQNRTLAHQFALVAAKHNYGHKVARMLSELQQEASKQGKLLNLFSSIPFSYVFTLCVLCPRRTYTNQIHNNVQWLNSHKKRSWRWYAEERSCCRPWRRRSTPACGKAIWTERSTSAALPCNATALFSVMRIA
jgi:tetratricopeptide (TPR) repeat protein